MVGADTLRQRSETDVTGLNRGIFGHERGEIKGEGLCLRTPLTDLRGSRIVESRPVKRTESKGGGGGGGDQNPKETLIRQWF